VAKLTPSAMMPPESELAALLRVLPFRIRCSGWRCPECGAFLRNGRVQEGLCSPCEERHERKTRDAHARQLGQAEEAAQVLPLVGVPDERISPEVVAKFWSYVSRNGGCWKWNGGKEDFPKFSFAKEVFQARRLSWELHFGPPPNGGHVWRACDGLGCTRPDHLRTGKRNAVA